jgi:hypothetical protein
MDRIAALHREARRRGRVQFWEIGAVVHVGFLTLRVYGKELGCGAWRLESLGGAKHYRFAPHRGLTRIG